MLQPVEIYDKTITAKKGNEEKLQLLELISYVFNNFRLVSMEQQEDWQDQRPACVYVSRVHTVMKSLLFFKTRDEDTNDTQLFDPIYGAF